MLISGVVEHARPFLTSSIWLVKDLNQDLKEWTQAIGVLGVAIAAFKGLWDMQSSARQRKADLRWKQANAAKDLIADVHHDKFASNCVRILDWSQGSTVHEIKEGQTVTLSYQQHVLPALQKNDQSACNLDEDHYIRNCFDWFFYYIDRIQHYIDRGLIEFEDVRSVFRPYVRKIGQHRSLYEEFVGFCEYELPLKFLRQYPEYTQAQEVKAQSAGA
jgi:hypothetical protein